MRQTEHERKSGENVVYKQLKCVSYYFDYKTTANTDVYI